MLNFKQRKEENPDIAFYVDVMVVSDLDAVLEIERSTFPSPWTKANFLFELYQNKCAYNFVVRSREQESVLGFSSVWILFDELKINNIAIAKERRGQGLGRFLLEHIIEFGYAKGCDVATLEVRPSNRTAMSMYRSFGFTIAGIRKGYYSDNGEDALLLSLDLSEWMKRVHSRENSSYRRM